MSLCLTFTAVNSADLHAEEKILPTLDSSELSTIVVGSDEIIPVPTVTEISPILIAPAGTSTGSAVDKYYSSETVKFKTRKNIFTLKNKVSVDVNINYPQIATDDEALQKKIRKVVYKQAYLNVVNSLKDEYSALADTYSKKADAPIFYLKGECYGQNQCGNILSIEMKYDVSSNDETRPYSFTKIININLTNGKLLKLNNVFKYNNSFKKAVTNSVKSQMMDEGGFYKWSKISDLVKSNIVTGKIFFEDNGIRYVFDDDTVADSGFLGNVSFRISFAELDSFIKENAYSLIHPTGLYTLSLPSNPSTGYSWEYIPANDGMVSNVFAKYVPNPVPEGIVGSGGNQTFGFVATGRFHGESTLRFVYKRPWTESEFDQTELIHIVVTEDGFITEVNSDN